MIQEIEISKLKIHPRNVRKNYNDIEELADSIRAQGILQNLTVVADPDEKGMYLVVIGNRRLTAAKKAGMKTAPCQVVELDEKEQASMMLLENMQRNDLTIYEQAQGFQMVLDLGETKEGLAEKTGLSKTTIHRRLNIAKLDQSLLEEKEQDKDFQLSLTDLYELEKIKDIDKRNQILERAKSSREVKSAVLSTIVEENREMHAKVIIAMLREKGIEEAPERASQEIYTNKWETVKTFDLNEETPKRITIKPDDGEKLYFLKYWREVKIIRKAKKTKKEKTPKEIARDEKDSRRKKIKAIAKNMAASRREFVLNIISGKVQKLKDETEVQKKLWDVMRKSSAYTGNDGMAGYIAGKPLWEIKDDEKQSAMERADRLSVTEMALICACRSVQDCEFTEYDGKFKASVGEYFKILYDVLGVYGYSYETEEERKIVEGTHELYTAEKEGEE